VYDGHAGRSSAEFLKENMYSVFTDVLDRYESSTRLATSTDASNAGLYCPLELNTVLTDSFQHADAELLTWLQGLEGDRAGSGCTATTVLVREDRLIVANVGDSRAVLARGSAVIDLSTEHRVWGKGGVVAAEIDRVVAAGGWIDDGRVCGVLAVSRAFGDPDFKGQGLDNLLIRGVEDGYWNMDFAASVEFRGDPVIARPDVLELPRQPEDELLVVATDGLWDVMSSQEATTLARNNLRRGASPQATAEKLTSLAMKRFTADNVAVVVVDLKGEEWWGTQGGAKKKMFGFF
jgi:protein phosphatase 1A